MSNQIKQIFFPDFSIPKINPNAKSEELKDMKKMYKSIRKSNNPEHIFVKGYLQQLINEQSNS